jgi:hypothetical protein
MKRMALDSTEELAPGTLTMIARTGSRENSWIVLDRYSQLTDEGDVIGEEISSFERVEWSP